MSTPPQRADKVLREALAWPRRLAEAAIASQRVTLSTPEGIEPVIFPDALVFPGDVLHVDGQAIPMAADRVAGAGRVLALHKPLGVITTQSDPLQRPCVGAWTARLGPGFFPVGRLDADTTGLLLLTEDGDLAHVLLHPKHHIEKTYLIFVAAEVSPGDPRLAAMTDGLLLDDGPARALQAEVLSHDALERIGVVGPSPAASRRSAGRLSDPSHRAVVRVVVTEGRNRLVRRMAAAAKLPLAALHRDRIGAVALGSLGVGEMRELAPDEVAGLWAPFGGLAALDAARRAALTRLLARWEDRSGPSGSPAGRRIERLRAWLAAAESTVPAHPAGR